MRSIQCKWPILCGSVRRNAPARSAWPSRLLRHVRGYVNEDVQPLDLLSQERVRTIDTVLVNIGGLVNIWGLWTFVLMDIWAYWICGLTSKGLAIAP